MAIICCLQIYMFCLITQKIEQTCRHLKGSRYTVPGSGRASVVSRPRSNIYTMLLLEIIHVRPGQVRAPTGTLISSYKSIMNIFYCATAGVRHEHGPAPAQCNVNQPLCNYFSILVEYSVAWQFKIFSLTIETRETIFSFHN